MSTTEASPPAGWYVDPSGHHECRWWDGDRWTTQVTDRREPEPEPDPEPAPDPMAGFDQLAGGGRKPPEERASTGAGLSPTANRRTLAVAVVLSLVVGGAAFWGYRNYESAQRWQDRGDELAAELETRASNADATERALSSAASRTARMADGQQQMNELRDATEATIGQLHACVASLNHVLEVVAASGDPAAGIADANRACGEATYNGETLISILDALDLE